MLVVSNILPACREKFARRTSHENTRKTPSLETLPQLRRAPGRAGAADAADDEPRPPARLRLDVRALPARGRDADARRRVRRRRGDPGARAALPRDPRGRRGRLGGERGDVPPARGGGGHREPRRDRPGRGGRAPDGGRDLRPGLRHRDDLLLARPGRRPPGDAPRPQARRGRGGRRRVRRSRRLAGVGGPCRAQAGFADVALFGEPTGRSALCGLHCIVGRKPAGGAA